MPKNACSLTPDVTGRARFYGVLALSMITMGACAYFGYPGVTAKKIGCPARDIVVMDVEHQGKTSRWKAMCHGRSYTCAGGKEDTVTCEEVLADASTGEETQDAGVDASTEPKVPEPAPSSEPASSSESTPASSPEESAEPPAESAPQQGDAPPPSEATPPSEGAQGVNPSSDAAPAPATETAPGAP